MRGSERRIKKVISDRLAVAEAQPIATQKQTKKKSPQIESPTLRAARELSMDSLSWGQFMTMVGLDPSEPAKASNAALALELASGMGIPVSPKHSSISGWYYTCNKRFAVRQPTTK